MTAQPANTRCDFPLSFISDIRQAEAELFTHNDSFSVMCSAAQGIFEVIQQQSNTINKQRSVHIVLGCGNNAGDGLVLTTLLHNAGWNVRAYCVFTHEFGGDALQAYNMAQSANVMIQPFKEFTCNNDDIIIEALFGIGFDRPASGDALSAIKHINACKQTYPHVVVYAVDIPAGIVTDTGAGIGEYIIADYTVTFIADKVGLHTADGKAAAGIVIAKDLEYHTPPSSHVFLYNYNNDKNISVSNQHKGDFGHTLVIGGDNGMFGASALASVSSLKAGSGKASVYAHPTYDSQFHINATPLYEVMRCQDLHTLAHNSVYNSIVLGPGLGRNEWGKQQFDITLQQHATSPNARLVIDADGLYHLAELKNSYPHVDVITPHESEAAKLLKTSITEIRKNKITAVKNLALHYQCITVLKGAGTLVSDGTTVWINSTGNVNLATAGTGDILAGLIGGYLARGFSPQDAALYAVNQHGQAADKYAKEHNEKSMRATDLWNYL
ncbi:MAG: NAD(P)H-hydrate dehydratase [Gammaproteobacteria bacterium]|nr:NAD(P)H-hydrate dehydratase [Gammaproteobacteria bacterium]